MDSTLFEKYKSETKSVKGDKGFSLNVHSDYETIELLHQVVDIISTMTDITTLYNKYKTANVLQLAIYAVINDEFEPYIRQRIIGNV